MKQLLREPLVHFLLLGAALFVAWHFMRSPVDDGPATREIRLSLGDITQQALMFKARWNREPTPAELAQLMESVVQEEILYREALALGLDKDDEIVKRRLAQKMQFLAEDVAAAREPSTAELSEWYAKNKAQFAMPARYSFRHMYFSPDRRRDHARDDAVRALARLAGQPENSALAGTLADPFMFQDYYRERAPDFLGKEFGPQFALGVEKLTPGSWQGPIESGFGWHLVFVDAVVPGRVPDLDEVMPDVKTAWLADRKATAWRKTYDAIRARYTVLLPRPPDEGLAGSPGPGPAASNPGSTEVPAPAPALAVPPT
jgi:peptidyl-prolyl cis-trans isomerase C